MIAMWCAQWLQAVCLLSAEHLSLNAGGSCAGIRVVVNVGRETWHVDRVSLSWPVRCATGISWHDMKSCVLQFSFPSGKCFVQNIPVGMSLYSDIQYHDSYSMYKDCSASVGSLRAPVPCTSSRTWHARWRKPLGVALFACRPTSRWISPKRNACATAAPRTSPDAMWAPIS